MRLFVAAILACAFLQTSGFPNDLKCIGSRQNEEIQYRILPDITREIYSCDIQWICDERVVGLYNGNGNTKYILPIINATASTASMVNTTGKLEYNLICPDISVNRRLTCSYLAPHCTATREPPPEPPSEPSANQTDEGFPTWWIALVVIAGFVFACGILILVYKLIKNRYDGVSTEEPA